MGLLTNASGLLDSPKTAGLLGMAEGLLAASGAHRLPVTMGQALGMGLQGSQQYQHAANANRLTQVQAQSAELGNQLMKARVGYIDHMLNGGSPASAPAYTAVDATPSFGGPTAVGNPNAAPSIGASQIGGGTPDGVGAIGAPGATGADNLHTVASHPQGTGNATLFGNSPYGQELAQQYQRGLMFNMLGLKGGSALMTNALDHSTVAAQKLASVKDAVNVDLANQREAQARGDQRAADMWATKAAQDSGELHVSGYNAATTLGVLHPNGQFEYQANLPQQGLMVRNNMEYTIPGAVGSQAAMEGGKANAREQAIASHNLVQVTQPDGSKTWEPRSSVLAQTGGGGGAAVPMRMPATRSPIANPGNFLRSPSQPRTGSATAELGPQAQSYLKARGDTNAKYLDQLQQDSDAAISLNHSLDEMKASLSGFTPGPYAELTQHVKNALGGIGQMFGMKMPDSVTNWQVFNKWGNKIAFAAARKMGARESEQIVRLQMKTNPNGKLSPDAIPELMSGMRAMSDYTVAKNSYLQNEASATNGNTTQAQAAWDRQVSPYAWDAALNEKLAKKAYGLVGARKMATSIQYMDTPKMFQVFNNLPVSQAQRVYDWFDKIAPKHVQADLHAYAKEWYAQHPSAEK